MKLTELLSWCLFQHHKLVFGLFSLKVVPVDGIQVVQDLVDRCPQVCVSFVDLGLQMLLGFTSSFTEDVVDLFLFCSLPVSIVCQFAL